MTPSDTTLRPLVYNGEVIHQRDEMLSLTDMWKAAGSDPSRTPYEWLRSGDGERFVEFLASTLGVTEPGKNRFGLVHVTKGGSTRGGTLAHWQVGLAFAKHLSPEFHMWCNTVVRERMMGRAHDAHLSADVLEMVRRTDGVVRSTIHKVTEMEKSFAIALTAMAQIASVVQPAVPVLIRHGQSAGQIWRAHGFPRIKITCWFSNRLTEMGCLMDGRAEAGTYSVKLFDPDKADAWLRNGGRILVEQKIAERRGQTVLPLRIVPTETQPSA